MFSPDYALTVKILAFTLAVIPVLFENLEHKTISNRNNLILFAGGLAMAGFENVAGWSDQSFDTTVVISVIAILATSTGNNPILFAGGLAVAAYGNFVGWPGQLVETTVVTSVVAILYTWLTRMCRLGGGATKMLVAFVPWFPNVDFFVVVTLAFLAGAIACKLARQPRFQVALPLTTSAFVVWLV